MPSSSRLLLSSRYVPLLRIYMRDSTNKQQSTQEPMQMGLRGGNGGGICCGMYAPFLPFIDSNMLIICSCAGLACFECCEICC